MQISDKKNRPIKKQLIEVFNQLNAMDQSSILSFSQFLLSKNDKENIPATLEQPADIKRPEDEKVVLALKRLSKTYPMIDKSNVFDQASKLMTDNMLHGRDAILVIDDLELLFDDHYKNYAKSFSIKEEQ